MREIDRRWPCDAVPSPQKVSILRLPFAFKLIECSYSEKEGKEIDVENDLYKPSGPDGKGWGDYRQLNENDLTLLDELNAKRKFEDKKQKQDVLQELNQRKLEE